MKPINRFLILFVLSFPLFGQAPELKVELKNTSQVYSVAVSPDGKWMATGTTGKIFVWDLEAGKMVQCVKGMVYPVFSLAFTTDSKSLILGIGNNNIELWDMESMTKTTSFFGHSSIIKDMKVSPNGKYIASLDHKNKVILWDIAKGKALREYDIQTTIVHTVDFSPSGKELVIGKMEGSILFIDLATGKTVKEINNRPFNNDDFVPGMSGDSVAMLAIRDYSMGNFVIPETGKIIQYHGNMITYWDIASGAMTDFKKLNMSPARGAATPDGKRAVIRSGKHFRLLDLEKWTILDTSDITPADFSPVASDPAGKYFVTGEVDGSVRFIEAATGKRAMTLYAFDTTDWAVVTPEGYFDASLGAMGLLYYVDGLDIIPLEAYFEKAYSPSLYRSVVEGKKVGTTSPGGDETFRNAMLPPSVGIYSPNESQIVNELEETVTMTVTDEGGGIDEIRLYQNGKLIDVKYYNDGKPKAGNKITLNFTAQMVSGNNIFRATAFSKGRLEGKSKPIVIKYNAPKPASTLYVIATGVDKYENSKYNLNFAKADAEAVTKTLTGIQNAIFKEVKVKLLFDHEATIANLRQAFTEIAANAKPEDTFVFYFSGHGASDEDAGGNETGFYFILHEVQQIYGNPSARDPFALSSKELKEWSLKIKAQKQLILIDACQSGQALENFAMRGPQTEKAIIDLSKSRGLYIMAASEADQTAKELRDLGHGVFTWSIIEGLKCNADFFEKDGIINVKELNMFVNKKVRETAQKYNLTPQRPVSWEYMNDFPVKVCE